MEHRDTNCIQEEREIHGKLVKSKAQLLDNQNKAELELQYVFFIILIKNIFMQVKANCDEIEIRHATCSKMFERFKAVITTLAPSTINTKLEKKRSFSKNQASKSKIKEEIKEKRKKIIDDDAKEKITPNGMKL